MRTIQLQGAVELQAADAGDDKPKRFSMVAYSGGILQLGGRIVVDVAGMEAKPGLPILRSHDAERIVGHADGIDIDRRTGNITVRGALSGDPVEVKRITGPASRGYQWQASIGASVGETEYVERGQSVSVNGRKFEGPLQVVRKSQLREVSFVAVGADAATSAAIAAKGSTMDGFNAYVEGLGFDPAGMSDAQRDALRAGYDAQQQRAAVHASGNAREIAALVAKYSRDFPNREDEIRAAAADAIEAGWDADRLEAKIVMDAMRAAGPGASSIQRGRPTGATSADVLTAALALQCGATPKYLAGSFGRDGERVVDAAMNRDVRNVSLQGVLRQVLRAAGMHVPTGRLGDADIRDAFTASNRLQASVGPSTISIPGILSNVANKLLLESFDATGTTWAKFCRVGNNVDFKAATRYRMTGSGEFQQIAPGGEIKHVSLRENSASAQLDSYGALIAIDRRDLINDDLGALQSVPRALGRMSAIKLEKSVYTLLLANTGNFFGTGNSNYESGAGSALGTTGLAAALSRFRSQVDANGDPTYLTPRVLLCPPLLESTALALMNSMENVATGDTDAVMPSGNSFKGLAEVVVAPFLGTAAGLTGSSNAAWYLLVGPGDFAVIEVATLNGVVTPTVETGSLDFDRLGFATRAYHDFSVNQFEHRGGVMNAGS